MATNTKTSKAFSEEELKRLRQAEEKFGRDALVGALKKRGQDDINTFKSRAQATLAEQQPQEIIPPTQQVEPIEMMAQAPSLPPRANKKTPLIDREAQPQPPQQPSAPAIEITRDSIENIMAKDPKTLTSEDQALLRKFRAKQALGQSITQIFGEESLEVGSTEAAEAEKAALREGVTAEEKRIKGETREIISDQESLIRAQVEREQRRLQEAGKRRQDTTQRLLSLRGVGRGTVATDAIMDIQNDTEELISAAQAKGDLEIALFRAKQEGAEADRITSLRKALADQEKLVDEKLEASLNQQKKINNQLGADFAQSIDSIINTLETGGVEIGDIDIQKTQDSGLNYFLNANGDIWINPKTGKPEPFKRNDLGQDIKISSFKDGNDNTFVYENGQLDSIITRNGEILTGDAVKSVKVPAEVKADQSAEQQREIETKLRKEFGSDPQIKRFNQIRSEFDRVQSGANADSAAGDLALIFSFMKMLDPTSVVREGEFATAQNATGIPERIRNLYNRAITGERLNVTQRTDFVDRAKDIFEQEKQTASSTRDFFVNIARDAGARTEFITGAFDDISGAGGFSKFEMIQEDDNNEINTFFQEAQAGKVDTTSGNIFSTQSGFKYDFSGLGLDKADQPAKTKDFTDLQSFIKKEEGFRSQAYLDPVGVPTIGYGFTSFKGQPVKLGQTITQQEAEEELESQIERHSNFKQQVTRELTPSQQVALSSFEFNLGPNIWKTPGAKPIIDNINKGNFDTAADIMLKFDKARDRETGKLQVLKGLTNRRKREANLLKINS